MAVATATIQFTPLRNDLANLPGQLSGTLFNANIPAQGAVIELTRTKPANASAKKAPPVFFGWTGLTAAKDSTVELDPTFAQNLGLTHGEKVSLRVIANASLAHTVHLEPLTSADWEIVETHVAFLETFMINQVRALAVGQTITVFPSASAIANLKVVKLDPPVPAGQAALLSPDSEVIVAPKVARAGGSEKGPSAITPAGPQTTVSAVVRASAYPEAGSETRALEISGQLPAGFLDDKPVVVSLATPALLAPSSSAASTEEPEVVTAKSIVAVYRRTEADSLGLSYGLRCALDLHGDAGIGVKVLIKQGPQTFQQSLAKSPATIRPYATNVSSKVSTSKHVFSDEETQALGIDLVFHGLIIPPITPFLPLGGIIEADRKEWTRVSRWELGSEVPVAESRKMGHLSPTEPTHPVVGQDSLVSDVISTTLSGNGTLLYGSRGSGKSVIIGEVMKAMRSQKIRPVVFKSGGYTDKAVSTVREALKKVAYAAAWSAPSVLVFDDIDKLIPAEQEHSGDAQRHQQLAEVFCAVVWPLMIKYDVSLLATAQDKSSIHSQLIHSHLLDELLHLRAPNQALREQVLGTALAELGLQRGKDLDLLEIVAETEGYQPGDLWILTDRLAAVLATAGTDIVTTDSFLSTAKDFVPVSLRGVKLEKPKTKWAEVGGMDNVKQVILETLDWPTKYAPVFANCPLRLRSGLLLYGYPGCGKTMLASAIASKTGLNFISVKGPEILNKYIGASEQSVRDLFDRAQAAKPCVLFFDEFDSIAPKRGHDSTGVTDRVVNQLLTQMDGAEGLDGVYVLAATSRPDMIDSALMRPGRLDKSLLCDMPSHKDRLDILTKAASSMQLAADVDLDYIAQKTEGFTGADLQAVMYSAYLNGVHKVLNSKEEMKPEVDTRGSVSLFQVQFDRDSDGKLKSRTVATTAESAEQYVAESRAPAENQKSSGPSADTILVGHDDIVTTLQESKPSISTKEVAKLRAIYAEFVSDRNGEMPPGTSSNEVGGRVTLQ